MKHLKVFGLGLLRSIWIIFIVFTIPVWLPIAIIHDVGCNDDQDRWLPCTTGLDDF